MTALTVRGTITPLAGPSRAGIDVHGWKGWIPDLKNEAERYQRPGTDGGGSQTIGRSALAEVACWRAEIGSATAITTIATLETLQNVVCKMVDCWGRTLKRVRIDSITATPASGKGPVVTGNNPATVIITISMRVERLADV